MTKVKLKQKQNQKKINTLKEKNKSAKKFTQHNIKKKIKEKSRMSKLFLNFEKFVYDYLNCEKTSKLS